MSTLLVSDLPAWLVLLFAFLFGAAWGSFFNVAIYRWPRDMSVVSPPSHCPACGAPIPAWRNVPILGWLLLRGRAACCGAKVSPRYFAVELLSALLAVALAEQVIVRSASSTTLLDAALSAGLYFVFVGGLIVATFVDLEWMEIPDEVSIGGTAIGLATATLRFPSPDLEDLVLGAGVGFLFVQLVLVWSWERLTGRRGMGEGDAKLLMLIGVFLGWQGAAFALVAGAIQGMIVAAVMLATGRSARPADPAPATDTTPEADTEDTWTAPAPLTTKDGVEASLEDQGRALSVRDRHRRLLWDWRGEDPSLLRRAIPFGPFLALAALEFLFFGTPLLDLYFGLFE